MILLLISMIAIVITTVVIMVPGMYVAGWFGTMIDRYPPLGYVLGTAVALNLVVVMVRTPAQLWDLTVVLGILAVGYCMYRAVRP